MPASATPNRLRARIHRIVSAMRRSGGTSVAADGKPELIVGLIGAVGSDLRQARDAVIAALAPYGYEVVPIRLSQLMREARGANAFLSEITHEDERILRHMDAGDEIRRQSGRNEAVGGLAIGWISDYRKERHEGTQAFNTAFVLDSLKHPAELEILDQVYRNRFIPISVHSPTVERQQRLAKSIATSHGEPEKSGEYEARAKALMERDEHDDDREHGQNVREAFTEGDAYVSTRPRSELDHGVARYFRLFFGDPFLTPTRDEYAMFQTHAAALRSADLSRQVGAAVLSDDGEIIAVGCNEVPRPFGGQYWSGDRRDCRDFRLGYDSNFKYRNEALETAFERLKGKLASDVDRDTFISSLRGTRLTQITEFGRTVHAEMAALLDAARRGAAVAGQRLFTTTFPCHNCARHIIGAGIKEVIYREPYEKSVAMELHKDAVAVDPTGPIDDKVVIRRFVGVGPPRYIDLFTMLDRKDVNGDRVTWEKATASPRLIKTETAYINNEEDFLADFKTAIKSVDLTKGLTNGSAQRMA